QTIEYVLIDMAKPPTGKLSLFNLYVALSRSHGRDTIRILRDFDERMFYEPHDEQLLMEDERLQKMDHETAARWTKVRGHTETTNGL
ncbi:uncharacterized protein LAESUDRAFT_667624, partial [Laetiporus sulphureus 93-53]